MMTMISSFRTMLDRPLAATDPFAALCGGHDGPVRPDSRKTVRRQRTHRDPAPLTLVDFCSDLGLRARRNRIAALDALRRRPDGYRAARPDVVAAAVTFTDVAA